MLVYGEAADPEDEVSWILRLLVGQDLGGLLLGIEVEGLEEVLENLEIGSLGPRSQAPRMSLGATTGLVWPQRSPTGPSAWAQVPRRWASAQLCETNTWISCAGCKSL